MAAAMSSGLSLVGIAENDNCTAEAFVSGGYDARNRKTQRDIKRDPATRQTLGDNKKPFYGIACGMGCSRQESVWPRRICHRMS
jgi:hypothetical protein